jgi:Arc/MetJ family transcription regulator
MMATNLALDDQLIEEAVRLGKHKTKREAVTAALEYYVKAHEREGIRDLIGQVEFYEDFDPKALRRRRRRV